MRASSQNRGRILPCKSAGNLCGVILHCAGNSDAFQLIAVGDLGGAKCQCAIQLRTDLSCCFDVELQSDRRIVVRLSRHRNGSYVTFLIASGGDRQCQHSVISDYCHAHIVIVSNLQLRLGISAIAIFSGRFQKLQKNFLKFHCISSSVVAVDNGKIPGSRVCYGSL